jgi:glycosyltransferase involved in cell wall biosynthesis
MNNHRLRIWLVTIGENLPLEPGIRLERTGMLAERLAREGHRVVWWTSAFNHYQKSWFVRGDAALQVAGITLRALKGFGYKKNISVRRFVDHRIIARKFKRISKTMEPPDVILAATPAYDLAFEAVRYAESHHVPVIVDIRDEWPDLFLTAVPRRWRGFARLVMASDFRMIKETMGGADALVAMMDTLLGWGLNYAGRARSLKDKVFYLGNKRLPSDIPSERASLALDRLDGKFVVTFIGTFVRNNDPSILLECAQSLSGLPIIFVLAGNGELFPEIEKQSRSRPNVLLPGWLDQRQMTVLLKRSHVGICPTAIKREAFPNKAFAYMAAGLPILSAFEGDIKNLIETYKIGYYFPPDDAAALTACILRLYQNKEAQKELAQNVKKVFDELFDAEMIYADYAKHIEMIAETGKRKPS